MHLFGISIVTEREGAAIGGRMRQSQNSSMRLGLNFCVLMCSAEEQPGDSPFCCAELKEILISVRDEGIAENDMRRG